MSRIFAAIILLFFISSVSGQKNNSKKETSTKNQFKGFEKSKGGLYYKIAKDKNAGKQVELRDIVTADMIYGTDDSIFFDSKKAGQPMQLMVVAPSYGSDVIGGFTLLRVGDEGTFKTKADTFFRVIAGMEMPEFIEQDAYLTFIIKITKAQTSEEIDAERQVEALKNMEIEMSLIQNFLTENQVETKPTESGLYYIETQAGSGKNAVKGSVVAVHYSGLLLSGEQFDDSYQRGQPLVFEMGSGQIIPGFDEGISYMKEGGKATLIIPSALAYGSQGPEGSIIGSYAPLRFDVELIEVSDLEKEETNIPMEMPADN